MSPEFIFKEKLWIWAAEKASWHFISVPKDITADINSISGPMKRGFGSVKVKVRIGVSIWHTSIFPDKKSGTFILPIKKEVREKNNLTEGDTTQIKLELVDFS